MSVQREIVRYEQVSSFQTPPGEETWVAILSCGHTVELNGPPAVAPSGPRYIDCPECAK